MADIQTVGDALRALRAQRDFVNASLTAAEAATPVDDALVASLKGKRRAIARTIRKLRGNDATPDDLRQELWDAFTELRDMEATPALFEREQWEESLYEVASKAATLPETTEEPQTLDRARAIGVLRRTALNADAAFDGVRETCFDYLERHFDTYVAGRPVDDVVQPVLAAIEGSELDEATLATQLAALEANAGRLKPPAGD